MGLTVNKRTIPKSAFKAAPVAVSAAGHGFVRAFCMVFNNIARLTSAGRSRVTMNAGPALCAPGPATIRAGSRPIQILCALLALSYIIPSPAAAVPAGTVITNTAQADFVLAGTPQTAFSNSVSTVTVLPGTSSSLELFRYAPSSPSIFLTVDITNYFNGAVFTPAPAPSDPATGTSIDLSVPVPLEPAGNFSQDDPVFIRLTDADGNSDPAVADTLSVTIEDTATATIETLLLNETGPDTGIFTGYIR